MKPHSKQHCIIISTKSITTCQLLTKNGKFNSIVVEQTHTDNRLHSTKIIRYCIALQHRELDQTHKQQNENGYATTECFLKNTNIDN